MSRPRGWDDDQAMRHVERRSNGSRRCKVHLKKLLGGGKQRRLVQPQQGSIDRRFVQELIRSAGHPVGRHDTTIQARSASEGCPRVGKCSCADFPRLRVGLVLSSVNRLSIPTPTSLRSATTNRLPRFHESKLFRLATPP